MAAPEDERRLERWARAAAVDRAVVFGGLAAAWQFLAAPVTMVLIARHLSPDAQGFYYLFASLLALQTYVELGLSTVILNSASHHYSRLIYTRHEGLSGDRDALLRLAGLGRFAFRWYGVASVVFVAAIGAGGHAFLSRHAGTVDWAAPWWTLIALSAAQLWALPLNAMLEGCNQVTNIQRFRLSQSVLRSLGLWLALGLQWGLWAAVVGAAVAFLRDIYLIGFEYRSFFRSLWNQAGASAIHWRKDIWPMQWRLALSGILSYFLFQGFTPVMFEYHGAVVAGQMGMTMAMVSALQGATHVWLQPRVPRFGMLIARRDFQTLDREWLHVTRVAVSVVLLGAVGLYTIVHVLNALQVPIASRLLPPLPTLLLLAGAVFMAFGYCLTAYLRAHVREPLLVLSVVTSALMAALVWVLGQRFGATGAAAAYLAVIGGISVPWEAWIWQRCRAAWHDD